jgi:hypothetical protein
MNCFPHSVIRAATAYIGVQAIDVVIAGVRDLLQQIGDRHDLPGLAIAALRNVFFDPGPLDRVRGIRGQALDGGNNTIPDGADWQHAGPLRAAVNVYRAGAANTDPATELAAGQSQFVAQDPEQWLFRIAVVLYFIAIDPQFHGHSPSLLCGNVIRRPVRTGRVHRDDAQITKGYGDPDAGEEEGIDYN